MLEVCKALQRPYLPWYTSLNANRTALRFRDLPVDIAGISTKLEDLSPAVDVHATRYVNAIEEAKIVLDVTARAGTEGAQNAAQRIEDFDYAFVQDLLRQRPGGILAPYRRHLDDMVSKGAGYLHLSLKRSVREKLGEFTDLDGMLRAAQRAFKDGFSENPFVVECPQLESVFPEPDLSAVAEIGERTLAQVFAAYEVDFDEQSGFRWLTSDTMQQYQGNWQDTVTFYGLETADFIYYLVDHPDGRHEPFLLERRPNAAGRPWYTITPGHMNNSPDPEHRFQPLIAAVYPTVQIMNITRTLIQSGALNTGRPMYQEVPVYSSGQTLPEIMTQPIEQRPVVLFDPDEKTLRSPRKGYRWEPVAVPDMDWLVKAYEQSQRDLQEFGFPAILAPDVTASGQANSAQQGAQQIEVANKYLGPALSNVARSLHELLTLVGDVVKGLGVPVTMPIRRRSQGASSRVRESVTVKADDFREQDLEVRLESIREAAKIAIRESNVRLVQLELMSRSKFLRQENDDYQEEAERIQLDSAKVLAEKRALETADAFIQSMAPAVMAQIAAEQQIPLPPNYTPASGGPAPGEQARFERPPMGATPGAGAPNPTPEQSGPLGTPESAGTAAVQGAP